MKLVYRNASPDQEVKVGDRVKTHRGEYGTVDSIEKPRSPASTGRVYVKIDGFVSGFYPSVIGAEWVDREDQAAYPTQGRRESE